MQIPELFILDTQNRNSILVLTNEVYNWLAKITLDASPSHSHSQKLRLYFQGYIQNIAFSKLQCGFYALDLILQVL